MSTVRLKNDSKELGKAGAVLSVPFVRGKELVAAGVAEYPARAYTDATPERINFLLDPDWGGETPRVLLIRADGTRLGISGELTPRQLQKLL